MTSFHTGDIPSMISHLKPFNVASIHTANVSNMIIIMSTRSDSLLTEFSPVTSFHTGNVSSIVPHFERSKYVFSLAPTPVTVFTLITLSVTI